LNHHGDERALVEAARLGDPAAFEKLVAPHRRELHIHCYRLTGSLTDADDMLQESLLKAWRAVPRFEPRAAFRAWLYKIATNTCLTELTARKRPGFLALDRWSGGPPVSEIAHLHPYPDRLLDESTDPADHVTRREAIALAFVAAIQLLPPRQRAVLILHDVLAWTSREIADALDASVAAVNSALQRARDTFKTHVDAGQPSADLATVGDAAEERLLERFMEAWSRADFDGIASLLQEDAVLAMPPGRMWFEGPHRIVDFFSTVPAGGELQKIRLLPIRANRQPAVAAFMTDPEDGGHEFYGIMVFSLTEDRVASITGFADPSLVEYFDLPRWLPSS
jgi:RNA polymerase sigma-70 factor, ECF subfamily